VLDPVAAGDLRCINSRVVVDVHPRVDAWLNQPDRASKVQRPF